MKKKIALGVLVFFILGGLALVQMLGPRLGMIFGKPIYIIEPEADEFGEIAFSYMDQMGIHSQEESWKKERETARKELTSVKSKEELRPLVEKYVKIAGGKHSFVMDNQGKEEMEAEFVLPETSFENGIVYVKLPGFMSTPEQGAKYANTIANAFQEENIRGAIVDLRGNTGGDMGPMVAGISPLLRDGEIMYFSSLAGDNAVTLENGINKGGGSSVEVENKEKVQDIPIGVLTDEKTASSGEATLIVLLGEKRVRTFGKPTAGYASANTIFPITKEWSMVLTISKNKSREGKIFEEEPMVPDENIERPLEAAKSWIEKETRG